MAVVILVLVVAVVAILILGQSGDSVPPNISADDDLDQMPRGRSSGTSSKPVSGKDTTTQTKPLNLPPIPRSLELQGKAYVIDGDTIRIGKTKIRLAGIDAPETHMPYGQKSKWAMVEICKGQIITAKLTGERSYDRLVGTCYLQDGRDIGAEIIKKGLALDLECFSGGKYRHHEPAGARRMLCNGKFGHSSLKKNAAYQQRNTRQM